MLSNVHSTRGHITSLEGWRGVVAFLVVNFHLYGLFSPEQFGAYGYLGVDFFFILSGFIIARQYEAVIAERSINIIQFAIRRIARLWPLYILSIVFFLYLNVTFIEPHHLSMQWDKAVELGSGPETGGMVLSQLLMISNFTGYPAAPWNSIAWSVSVEWIVNLLFFILVYVFRGIPTLLLGLVIIYCTYYLMIISPQSLNLFVATEPFFNPTIARGMVGFSLGMLICRYHQSFPVLSPFRLYIMEAIFALVVLQLIMMHGQPFVIGVDYIFQLLVFPALIILSLYPKGWIARIMSHAVPCFLGRISYSVYLLHIPLFYTFQYSRYFDVFPMPYRGIIFYSFLIVICALVYYLIEKPSRKWIRQFGD